RSMLPRLAGTKRMPRASRGSAAMIVIQREIAAPRPLSAQPPAASAPAATVISASIGIPPHLSLHRSISRHYVYLTTTDQPVESRAERTKKGSRKATWFAIAPTVATMEETDARGPHRPPRDAYPGATRRCVRPPQRSGEDPALDGNGSAD